VAAADVTNDFSAPHIEAPNGLAPIWLAANGARVVKRGKRPVAIACQGADHLHARGGA
jgi:hypothetical protein